MTTDAELQKLDKTTLHFVATDLMNKSSKLMDIIRDQETMEALGLDRTQQIARVDTLGALAAHYRLLASKLPDAPAAPRPRDFMAQAVSWVLTDRMPLGAPEVLARILHDNSCCKKLLVREPTIDHVRDTLSAGSRGKNPRFIRTAPGLYIRNTKYKAPTRK